MEKSELLQGIQQLAAEGTVTSDELLAAYNQGSLDHPAARRLNIGNIMYYLGGAIVFIGIAVLVSGGWSDFSPFTRILVTLGSGVAAYIAGLLFSQQEKHDGISQAFYLISALVIPVGLYVVFDNAGFAVYTNAMQTLIAFILVCVYGLSAYLFRKTIFTIFTIIFSTSLFFALTSLIVGASPIFNQNLELYQTLAAGLSYMFLGYHFSKGTQQEALSGWLYGFGSLGFLGAALALGGWSPAQNAFWELVYPLLVFGIIFLSVYVKSRAFLIWGSLFLMGYILKITGEYFSQGLGWPLALVLAGLLLIAVGYYSAFLNKKYISGGKA